MNISVEIRRSDLAVLTLYLLPRARSNWVFLGIVAVGTFTYILLTKKPCTLFSVSVAVGASIVGGIAALLIGVAISLTTMLLTVGNKSGVLGVHHYTLTPEGLHERTDVNESIQKWPGILSIRNVGSCLLFQINDYLFHIVPRRAFPSTEQFNAFYEHAKALKHAA
jgi:hypothetical protein